MVGLVQLVERQIVDLVVGGSSPLSHPTQKHNLLAVLFFNQKSILPLTVGFFVSPLRHLSCGGPHILVNSILGELLFLFKKKQKSHLQSVAILFPLRRHKLHLCQINLTSKLIVSLGLFIPLSRSTFVSWEILFSQISYLLGCSFYFTTISLYSFAPLSCSNKFSQDFYFLLCF